MQLNHTPREVREDRQHEARLEHAVLSATVQCYGSRSHNVGGCQRHDMSDEAGVGKS